ncbi:MAG: family containing protein [Micrococcaceae bacterium]|jgi:hypothetical protein|nr:family containing protein [Micrococcaceae bacterium]
MSTYELRTYTTADGRMPALLQRFRDHTLALFSEHGIENVGYWVNADNANELIYVVRHEGDPAANWAAFQADQRWKEAKAASLLDGEITTNVSSTYMTPTDFSALN